MIRCFDSADIQNVNENVNPIRDLEIVETEMKLADIESIEKRLNKKNSLDEIQRSILRSTLEIINKNQDPKILYKDFEIKDIKMTGLLTLKPKLFVCNVDEQSISIGNNYTDKFIKKYSKDNTIIISAEIENQINQIEDNERKNYMSMLSIKDTGLNNLIKKGYKLLDLNTFFTSGPEESRAWTVKRNSTAPKAAREIHTDFEKGFIRAETVSYKDFIESNGWLESKNKGKMRLEGKDYVVQDGDILNFRFNT